MVQMNQELGTTFIFSTHDPRVMDYAHRLLEIRDGTISQDKRRGKGRCSSLSWLLESTSSSQPYNDYRVYHCHGHLFYILMDSLIGGMTEMSYVP